MRFLLNVTGMQGIGNSGLGTVICQGNLRYHKMSVFTTIAGALADPTTVCSNFKLKVGGVVMRDMSPSQAIRLAKLYKITPGLGEIPIFFSEPWLADPRTREVFSWDMFGQGKFTLEMTFLNPGGGAVGIQNIVAQVDSLRNTTKVNGKDQPFLKIIKAKTETFVFTGAQRLGNTGLDVTLPIRRLLIDASANGFSDVEVLADSLSVYNQTTLTQLTDDLNAEGIDATQFGLPLVFDFDGLARSKLSAQKLEVKLTSTGALVASFLNMQEAQAFA